MPLTKIKSLGITDGTIVNADINASAAIDASKLTGVASGILQVKHLTYTSTQTVTNSSTWTEVSGFNLSITPTSSSSKILVNMVINGASSNWAIGRLYRDGSAISGAKPADVSNRFGSTTSGMYRDNTNQGRPFIINYLDSPSTTSSINYSLAVSNWDSFTFYLNRSEADNDYSAVGRYISTITLTEISSTVL